MCGIVGALSFGKTDDKLEKLRKEVTAFLVTELLLLTAERGKDATGVTTLFDNGDYMGLKMGIASPEFVSRWGGTSKDYEGFLKVFRKNPRECKVVLGHCRKSSIGNYWDNNNNHPIKVGDIVGIHNGTLTNHKKIIEKLGGKKDGDVDSEAIFRLAHHLTAGGKEPFTIEMLYQTAVRLDGSYAVLMYNGNNPYQVGALRNGRPMEMVLVKPLKMVFVASEKKFLETAMWRMNKQVKLYNGENLIHLTSDDVDFQMMYDDHVAIFDLTKEVTKDTKTTDLIEDKRIVATDKKWQTPTSTTTYYNRNTGWQGNNKSTVHKPAAEVNASAKDDDKTTTPAAKTNKTDKKVGMVWNRSLNEYEVAENTDDTDKLGNVEIGVEADTVIEVGENDKDITDNVKSKKGKKASANADEDDIDLKEVDETCEDLVTDPAKVNEIAVKSIEDEKKKTKEKDKKAISGGTAVEVDASEISFDSKALEEANKATEVLEKCENDADVVAQLQLESENALELIPRHSLVNRVKSFAYKLGFYDGFMKRKEEEKYTFGKEVSDDKGKKREKNIRVLKTMALVMSRIINNKSVGLDQIRAIDEEIAKSLEKKEEIDSSIIKELFTIGDFRKEKTLKIIASAVEEKEGR
jgi:hypothetical protein